MPTGDWRVRVRARARGTGCRSPLSCRTRTLARATLGRGELREPGCRTGAWSRGARPSRCASRARISVPAHRGLLDLPVADPGVRNHFRGKRSDLPSPRLPQYRQMTARLLRIGIAGSRHKHGVVLVHSHDPYCPCSGSGLNRKMLAIRQNVDLPQVINRLFALLIVILNELVDLVKMGNRTQLTSWGFAIASVSSSCVTLGLCKLYGHVHGDILLRNYQSMSELEREQWLSILNGLEWYRLGGLVAVVLAGFALKQEPHWPALIYGPLALLAGLASIIIT